MGKKKDRSRLTKCVNVSVAIVYIIINMMMFAMLILRIVTVFTDRSDIDLKRFPNDCTPSRIEGCSRIVLDKIYCHHVEDLDLKSYTLIYNS